MNIRKATIDDINELVRLNSEVQSLHVDIEPDVFCDVGEADLREFFQNRLAQADFRTFIAEDEGYPVGYMSVRVARRPGHLFVKKREGVTIDQICATKHRRQKGIGAGRWGSASCQMKTRLRKNLNANTLLLP